MLVSKAIKMAMGYCPKCKNACEIIFRYSRKIIVKGVEVGEVHSKKPMPIPVNHTC